jgi:LysR family transcriptional regulator, transcriptional activator of the cysJI operon
MITTSQLRAFSAVARHRHFTRAAEELQIAQPSVSYQVRELERQMSVRLVDVVGRRVYLTDAGERLAERAAGLLNELEAVEQEMRDFGAGIVGRLRLGATRTVGSYALPQVLGEFKAGHPGIDLRVTIDNTHVIERLLLDRSVDLGVVEWNVEDPGLLSRPLRCDSLVLVCSREHPLAGLGRTLTMEDLRGQSFVMREHGSGTRALTEQALGPVSKGISVTMEFDQPEAILRAVEAGMGLAFISEVIVAQHVASGRLRTLSVEGAELRREFSLVTLRDRSPSPAMKAFSSFLVDEWDRR